MKICHINLAKEFNGAERQTELLIRALAEKPVEQILLLRPHSPLLTRLADLDTIKIRVVRSPIMLNSSQCKDCDIIHAHEINAAVLAYAAHKRYGKPFTLTSRHFSRPDSHPVARKIFDKIQLVIAASRKIEQTLLSYDPRLKVKVIPPMSAHFKITEEFRGLKEKYADHFLIGHICSSTDEDPGDKNLLKTAHQLARKNPKLKFIFIGSNKKRLNLNAATQGVNYIEVYGSKRNIGDYLNCFDIFISPETKPNIKPPLIDAMEQGVAIIATDTSFNAEFIQNEINGLLVDKNKPEQLAKSIERLYNDPELREKLRLEAQRYAKRYIPETLAIQYFQTYQELMAGHYFKKNP